MRYIYFLALCFSLILARENPFKPSKIADDNVSSTNIINKAQDFSQVSLNLPSDAREIDSIIVRYKSIDGSIKSKSVKIDAKFDWHDTLFFGKKTSSSEYLGTEMEIIKEDSNISSAKTTNNNKNATDKNATKGDPTNLGSLEFENRLKINIFTNKITLNTSDVLLKSYHDGIRIVLDFATTDVDFLTRVLNFRKGVLKRATIGSHGKFYRLILHFDAYYKYSIRQNNDGYTLWLGK